jgi:tetrahydromethanopterin S-methyltransferase subunit G
MAIERDCAADSTPEALAQLHKRLDEIEEAVNQIKTPLSSADQLYVLRDHIGMVRQRLGGAPRGK